MHEYVLMLNCWAPWAALKVISFSGSHCCVTLSQRVISKSRLAVSLIAGVAIFHFRQLRGNRRFCNHPEGPCKIAAIIITSAPLPGLFLLYGPLFSYGRLAIVKGSGRTTWARCLFRTKPLPTIRTDYKLFLTAVAVPATNSPWKRVTLAVANFAC